MLAGAIAGSATVLITNPIWVVNTRMTARQSPSESQELPTLQNPSTSKKPTTIGTLLSLLRTEGPTALFAGVLPALVLVINPILQYTIFEQLKNILEKRRKVQPLDVFFLSALGKLLATGITYPYITVKSRMHVASNKEGEGEGMLGSLRKCVRDEGWGGLYKGILLFVGHKLEHVELMWTFRDRTQGHAKCDNSGISIHIQGCVIRSKRQSQKENPAEAPSLRRVERQFCATPV